MNDGREGTAQEAIDGYDFGSDVEVIGMDGWDRTDPGDEWCRKVYVESEATREINEGSIAVTFVVRFEPSGHRVAEAYAIDHGGNIFGTAAKAD